MANTVATVEHSSAPAPEHEAEGGLLTAPFFISLAMVVIVLGLIWKKVPAAIGKALDSKIDVIRQQLSEAETLRKDAEALKAEYEKKAKAADKEAASIVERAKHEESVHHPFGVPHGDRLCAKLDSSLTKATDISNSHSRTMRAVIALRQTQPWPS